jgi:DNA replication protein DnaD
MFEYNTQETITQNTHKSSHDFSYLQHDTQHLTYYTVMRLEKTEVTSQSKYKFIKPDARA